MLQIFVIIQQWQQMVLRPYCLSNAMHGQTINLPVCMCECVSVTLSVNSPTGQTPQWIFTVDSLKDAYLRKDVPFGGLDDEQSHLGAQSPQNPHFGGTNRQQAAYQTDKKSKHNHT